MQIRHFDDLGYKLTTVKTEKFKTNLLSFTFHSDINRENVTKRSLIPYVLRSSTKRFPTKKKFNTALEDLYGASLSATTEKKGKAHNIKFYLSLANEAFLPGNEPLMEEAILLFKEMLLNPLARDGAFDRTVVETEKRLLEEYIESLYDDKTSYALQKLIENMCQEEMYAINSSGYIEDLPGVDAHNLYEEYQKMLESDALEIAVVGDIDADKVHGLFKKHLNLKTPVKSKDTLDLEEKSIGQVEIVKETQDIAQGKLNIGYRTHTRINDPDYLPLLVFNGMFGGYAHSKLFMNVREKSSLCYYCASRLDNFKGLMYVYSGIEPKNYEKALAIIEEQLTDMKTGAFTEKELELSKKSLINSKLESLDQAAGMLAHETLNEMLPIPFTVESWIKAINSITIEQITAVAKKIETDTIYFLTGKEVE
ncbi:MAG: insulinase family protein [Turicibacter sp.]|nr:insulinase family protein [Turicibacter sp.]